MKNISIFAKLAFLNVNPGQPFKRENYNGRGHLQRVSSIIRGEQIAEAIGAKLNPENGFENDICIYVKPHLKKDDVIYDFAKNSYLDIIDGHNLTQMVKNHPDVKVIVCSQADYDIMLKELSNKIVLIPQHHCNFERLKRNRKGIKTIGVIGVDKAFDFLPKDLEKELGKRDIKLIKFSKFFERQDIIDFYKSIDLQIVWRPYRKILSNPLKIVNSASFGIPTIAFDEPAFKEMGKSYIGVHNFKEFLIKLDELIDDSNLYNLLSCLCFVKAENYHIDKIKKLYQELI
jgi:hypothetical protein